MLLLLIQETQIKSQTHTKHSTHVSTHGTKTTRTETMTRSDILIEEKILTKGHQALSVIPAGDEVIIYNPEDAKKFHQKFKAKAGKVVTLYHKGIRVKDFNDKNVFLHQ